MTDTPDSEESRVIAGFNALKQRFKRRPLLRIALWEAGLIRTTNRRVMVVALVAAVVLLGGGGLAIASGGATSPTSDLYVVGVSPDSPYYGVVDESTTLTPTDPPDEHPADSGLPLVIGSCSSLPEQAVRLESGCVYYSDTQKGRAAYSTFRDAVRSYNTYKMSQEPNQSAAFPVGVTLIYQDRELTTGQQSGGGGSGGGSGGESAGGDGGGGSVGGDSADTADSGQESDGGANSVLGQGIGGAFSSTQTGSPADIRPPFPFGALLLAFLFLLPLNFVVQAYGSSIIDERINRRGELMLSAPLSPQTIVLGKTLPYALVTLGLITTISFGVGGGLLSIAAVIPIAALYLTTTFLGGMLARSFKELNFVTVTVTVLLTSYVFIPTIFSQVSSIALISPLTLVVRDLQGTGATLGQYMFSTGPFYLGSFVLFTLGIGVYREEDMFTQKAVSLKFLDALSSRLTGLKSVAIGGGLSLPFVFLAELLLIAVLFALPIGSSVVVILVLVAAIEEVAKSLHIYAGYHNEKLQPGVRMAVKYGIASGTGFFLAEKATHLAQLVGLSEVAIGSTVLSTTTPTGLFIIGSITLPLLAHTTTTTIATLGARKSKYTYAGGLLVATLVHAAYNLTVVSLLV